HINLISLKSIHSILLFLVAFVYAMSFSPTIDFTDPKDTRHDITLMLDGGKLCTSKQILAVHSPVFNAMFYGNFVEKDKNEVKLQDVCREDFHVALKTLHNPAYEIEEDMRLLDSLLVIADRFDIKAIIDRVEERLINTKSFSAAQLILFVDQHDTFRFIKLH
ncbi:hypothetical protein PMAYCL1PPCAC_25219, partial [Pristionchus mayeri]